MTEEEALYVREGDGFVGTKLTLGAWYPNGQSGGAVLSLLGHVLEEVPTLTPMSVTRMTVDIVRPVPAGEHLVVEPTIVREGKKVQVVDLTLTTAEHGARLSGGERGARLSRGERGSRPSGGERGTTEHVRARALRIRDADIGDVEGMPRSSTDADPAGALPPPEELNGIEGHPGVAPFLRHAAEFRPVPERVDGLHGVWVRLKVPVVAGEPVRATTKVTMPMDLVNLIGVWFDARQARAINPDVTAHVFRPPEGEWIALVGSTRFSPDVGHGVSMATMSDSRGVFGITSTSQLVEPAPRSQ